MKYMSLFAKSVEEEDETTKTLKATARKESKLLRNQGMEKGLKDKVQHALNVEFGIEEDDGDGGSGIDKGRKLPADDDDYSGADTLTSRLPKKRSKVGKKGMSTKPLSSGIEDSNNMSSKNFDPFFVEESVNDEGVEVGIVHTDE